MLALIAVATLAEAFSPAAAQQPPAEALDEISRQTGMSKEEILRRYSSAKPDTSADTLGVDTTRAPGRTTLPPAAKVPIATVPRTPEVPAVILPFESEPAAAAARPATKGPARGARAPAYPVFGASFFRLQPGVFTQSTFGPVPEDYVIGVGDQIVVDMWGDVEQHIERIVDRDGTIILPKGGKILCSGRTLAELKRAVRERLSRSYSGISANPDEGSTFVDVSLGKLRAIRVFVIGDAVQPGAYDLSSLATIFTALYAAGGPSTTGSMRDVRLVRGNQTIARFDLYSYLLAGDRSNDLVLHEYDTVFIPPRARSVLLTGAVRREMVFELKEGENLGDLLRFGGGFKATAATEVLHVERILPSAQRRPGEPDRIQFDIAMDAATGEPANPAQAEMLDGDVVRVGLVSDRLENWVAIAGAVKRPGRYQYQAGMDVSSLVELAGQTWPDFLRERATIDRIAADGTYQASDIPVGDVLAGNAPKVLLQPRDSVRVFSKWEIQDLSDVSISGEVRSPGRFPFREGMTLRDLILKANGLRESADSLKAVVSRMRRDAIESRATQTPPGQTAEILDVPLGRTFLTDKESFPLQPHDVVAIRRLPWWEGLRGVVLRGEVVYPGVYTLLGRNETLSDVIARASGLKPTAFPAGARLIRSQDAIGRVAIDLACAVEDPHSACDLTLVDGDSILVPETPHTVKVIGAVGYPTSIPFAEGKKPGYYVDRAGGFAEGADEGKTRVVYPNGLSRPVRKWWWDPKVMAGSTVVVPYRPPEQKPDYLGTIEKVTGIIASVATTYIVVRKLP